MSGIPVVVSGTLSNVTVARVERVNNVSIKALPCPKVNDKGLTRAWWLADKIAMGVSFWATYQTWKTAKAEYKIGKRYYNLAKERWDFFFKFYRPLEEQELDEIWAEQPYEPDYTTAVTGHTGLIPMTYHNAEQHRAALAAKYCICPDVSQFTRTELTRATVFGDSSNFARRYAEKLAQERNDIRWNRRIAAASRGRNLLSDSASAADKASNFFRSANDAWRGLAESAMQFSGYIRHRHQTEYNPDRVRIDSRIAVPDMENGFRHQPYWAERGVYENTARGGLSWASPDGSPPYSSSGFDPVGGYALHPINR